MASSSRLQRVHFYMMLLLLSGLVFALGISRISSLRFHRFKVDLDGKKSVCFVPFFFLLLFPSLLSLFPSLPYKLLTLERLVQDVLTRRFQYLNFTSSPEQQVWYQEEKEDSIFLQLNPGTSSETAERPHQAPVFTVEKEMRTSHDFLGYLERELALSKRGADPLLWKARLATIHLAKNGISQIPCAKNWKQGHKHESGYDFVARQAGPWRNGSRGHLTVRTVELNNGGNVRDWFKTHGAYVQAWFLPASKHAVNIFFRITHSK